MSKKRKVDELWVAPRSSLKGNDDNRAWDHRSAPVGVARFLELADVAFGQKKPAPPKRKIA